MKILYVHPDPKRRACFSAEMEDMSVTIIGAGSSEEAKQIVLDHQDLAAVVTDNESHCRVVIISNYRASEEVRVESAGGIEISRYGLKKLLVNQLGLEKCPLQD